MEAYTTGASWGFPNDIPGGIYAEEQNNGWEKVDAEDVTKQENPLPSTLHTETEGTEHTPAADGQPDQQEQEQRERHWRPRTCRICLETVLPTFHPASESLPSMLAGRPKVIYESEDGGRLLRPCKCKGSQKYVHEDCLAAWRRQNPLERRNYWQCPTCRYSYRLSRLTWGQWLGSTSAQIGLTVVIFIIATFALGYVADPIINLYLDPMYTIQSAGGPTGSLIFEDEAAGWTEHFVKGLASLGLLGFAKFVLTLSPWHWWNMRGTGMMGGGGVARSAAGGTGRDRMRDISWIAVVVGIITFLVAVWKGVRAWSRRTLESAGEKVMDVGGDDDDEDEDE